MARGGVKEGRFGGKTEDGVKEGWAAGVGQVERES